MAGFGDKPFGLRQVVITDSAGANPVTLPRAMMLHVAPRMSSMDLLAEGVLVAASAWVEAAEWELEAGGLSLEAFAKLTGLSVTTAGSTPNRTWTLTASAGVEFPYIRLQGRAVGDVGTDDVYVKLFRCKLTSIEGTFRRGDFWISSAAGVAVSSSSGLLEIVQRETGATI